MLKSLRWRLQLWYALVLLAVVGGFAGLLYVQMRVSRLGDIDHDLDASAHYFDAALRRFPPSEFGRASGHERLRQPPPEMFPDDFDRPFPPPGPPSRERLLRELELPRPPGPGPGRLGADESRYFAIWRSDGTILKATDPPPGLERPEASPGGPSHPAALRQRGEYREAVMLGPGRTTILVGESIRPQLDALRAFAWQLAGVSAIVLVVGLAGGWLVSARILRPIAAISSTASAISETSLAQRIDVGEVDRELAGLAAILNDTFARLEAAFARQIRFTADASHELRTPLAILRSHAELSLSRARTPEEYRQTIEACLRAAVRMTELVEDLLLLARADAGKLDIRKERLDLKQVVEETIILLLPLADAKGVRVTAELASARMLGDAGRLAQVITNLLTNAIQHNRAGTGVHVRLAAADGEIELRVEDTGPGIPAAERAHLFERFYRVDKARSRTSGGYGLGLAICKSVVEAHGGTIGVESALERGSVFWVRLPCETERSKNFTIETSSPRTG